MPTLTRPKFLFTTHFADKNRAKITAAEPIPEPMVESITTPEPEPTPMISVEEAELAKKLAFEEGREAGRLDAEASLATRQLEATRRVETLLEELLTNEAERARHFDATAAQFALAMVEKLLPSWQRQHAEAEITKLLHEAIALAPKPAAMMLYCAADDAILANAIATSMNTPITVQTDGSLSCGDMRVEWEGGGLELSLSHALNALHQIINAHQPPTTHKE